MITTKALDFLSLNRFQNSREWFNAHKDEYNEHCLKPMIELVQELEPTLDKIDSLIVTEPKVDKTISRIYRDMRYCRDGMLFREQLWLSFKRNKKEFPGYPEFYFVLSPEGLFYGCGYYAASAEALKTMREMILNDDEMYLAAQKAYESQSTFIMSGDRLKKSKYPEQSEIKRSWLDRKNIFFQYTAENISELFEKELGAKMAAAFAKMKPVYDFFIAVELKTREKEFRV